MIRFNDLLRSQLRRNMLSSVVMTVANVFVGLIAFPVYYHYLGAKMYGLWLTLALVLQFSRFGMLGIPEAITKFISEESGRGPKQEIQACLTTATLTVMASGAIVVMAVTLLRHPIISVLNLDPAHASLAEKFIPLLALLSAYIFVVEVINAALSGLGRMDQANYIRSIARFLTLIVSISLLLAVCRTWVAGGEMVLMV